jgi:hypothetical protein
MAGVCANAARVCTISAIQTRACFAEPCGACRAVRAGLTLPARLELSWEGCNDQLNRMGHISLRVADQEASKRFYRDLLGFRIAEEDPEHGGVLCS